MAQVNFRIDDETKRRAESLFNSMGLTMSGAITIFIQQTLNRNEIPFPVQGATPPTQTKEELLRRIDDMEHGRNCHFHTDEEMERMIAEAEKHQNAKRRTKAMRSTASSSSARRRPAA